jgi:hypothetical protein
LLWTVTDFSFSFSIKIKLTVGNLSTFITIQNAFVLVDSNSSVLVTFRIKHMFIWMSFLTMADTITSKNIHPSSWISLYTNSIRHCPSVPPPWQGWLQCVHHVQIASSHSTAIPWQQS